MAIETKPPGQAGIWATFRGSPLAVKTILGGVFVSRLSAFLNLFVVLYLTSKGYSASQAALALGAYGVGNVVGVLIGGALADRLGARNATVISMTSAAALTASILYLPGYGLVLAAVVLVGLAGQIYRPSSATLLSDLTPEGRQVMIFAMYRFGLNLGAMAAPLIGLALYNMNHQRYTLLFWGEALIALAYAVLAQATLPARASKVAGSTPDAAAEPDSGYLAVLRDRRFVFYITAAFLNGAVYVQYLSTLPLDITASGLALFWYTLAVSLNGFAVIAFELLVTRVSQNWPFRVTIVSGVALVGLGMAIYGLPLVPVVIVIGTLIWTLAEIVGAPAAFAYPAVVAPAHLKGRYIGSFQFMFALGLAAGPMVGGPLFTALGHRVWPVLAIGSVLSTIFMLLGVENQPKAAEASTLAETPVA
jgi:MFS family permease